MTERIEKSTSLLPRLSWGSVSDKGKLRPENEDSYYINEELTLFIISDGMGGHRGGRLASRIIVEDLPVMIETGLNKLRSPSPRAIRALLKRAIIEQNRHMFLEGYSESGYVDMGATVVVVFIKNGRIYVANVGDSQAFRLRHRRLWQITKDHTVISELLEENKIDQSQIDNHPAQGQITQYIGMQEGIRPHIRSFALQENDALLLCTDGLTDMLPAGHICRILTQMPEPQDICQSLVDASNQAGGHDNITVVYLRC